MEVLEANQMHVFPRMFFIDVDECANTPCKNRAACVNLKGSYRCDCKFGYIGKNCQIGEILSINFLQSCCANCI